MSNRYLFIYEELEKNYKEIVFGILSRMIIISWTLSSIENYIFNLHDDNDLTSKLSFIYLHISIHCPQVRHQELELNYQVNSNPLQRI